jgi:hypothetical protein
MRLPGSKFTGIHNSFRSFHKLYDAAGVTGVADTLFLYSFGIDQLSHIGDKCV